MASLTASISQPQSLYIKPRTPPRCQFQFRSVFLCWPAARVRGTGAVTMPRKAVIVSAATAERPKRKGESKGFVEEMRFVAMRLHTRDQAKEGQKEVTKPEETAVTKWDPTVEGYLRFLVDSKVVYDTLESIVQEAPHPFYAEFRNTGLERSASLAEDLDWFKEQGYTIPEPSSPGLTYAQYLKELSVKDPQAFVCHFYNIYFAHSAGGRMIGKKIHSKKRNRLQHQKLQDLVYVKYNQALIDCFHSRDVVDPIALKEIDESNEWLLGEQLEEEQKDAEDELVFDDDDLTWLDVANATGASEPLKYSRRQTQMKKVDIAHEKGKNVLQVEEEIGDKDEEEYNSNDSGSEKLLDDNELDLEDEEY